MFLILFYENSETASWELFASKYLYSFSSRVKNDKIKKYGLIIQKSSIESERDAK